MTDSVMTPRRKAGLFIPPVATFFLASMLMVQARCRTGDYPCGDWPRDGFTWHIIPIYIAGILAWGFASIYISRQHDTGLLEAANMVGDASAPFLGLALGFSWYGLTGDEFHAPECTTPVVCHDAAWWSLLVWIVPFLAWGSWSVIKLAIPSDD